MTQLLDARKTIKVILPSYPDVTVELYDGLLTGEIGELNKVTTDYERGLETLRLLIKSWSFVDAKEKILPVTIDNLKLLPAKDFTALMNAIEKTMKVEEEKKMKN